MKFNGKELFAMGCPQARIKFLIGQEFESEEAAKAAFVAQPLKKEVENNPDSIFNFLASLPRTWLPMAFNGELPVQMSNSELRRLLDSGGILVNGTAPKANDDFEFPIWQLIFFPRSQTRKTTMILEQTPK